MNHSADDHLSGTRGRSIRTRRTLVTHLGLILVTAFSLLACATGSSVSGPAATTGQVSAAAPTSQVSVAQLATSTAIPLQPTAVAQATLPAAAPTNTPVPEESGPTVVLNPSAGAPGAKVMVQGAGWPQNSTVIVYLMPSTPPSFALGAALADAQGKFAVEMIVPSDTRWLNESPVPVVARIEGQNVKAQTFLDVTSPSAQETRTPDQVIIVPVSFQPTPAAPLPSVNIAKLTSSTNLNVRSGPGTNYNVLGVLRPGDQAEITGRNADSTWWQIEYATAPQGSGWVSAAYVKAENFDQVPVVGAPAPPSNPTPSPQQQVVTPDWRGEYYSNRNLSGDPVFVRNDPYISFDWGLGSPDTRIPVDNFSIRWTRTMNFPAGTYRFYARVDDGARLWIDNNLVIDQWVEGSARTFTTDVYLTDGPHYFRMEYFEATRYAMALLSWERVENYPDWKAEYYTNPNLQGAPALVRNEGSINYNWGGQSPAQGIPGENFSVRWTRQAYFEGGDYLFRTQADDGVRIWLNNDLIIDYWRDGVSPALEAKRNLSTGTYQLRVEYYQRSGGSFIGFSWQRVDRPDNPPVAVIRAPSKSVTGQPIECDGGRSYSDNKIVRYEWDFGDGTRASGKKVSHTYSSANKYTVKLTVTDSRGLRDSTKVTVQVSKAPDPDQPPVPVIDSPTVAKMGEPVQFSSSRSRAVNRIVSRDWAFSDNTSAQGENVNHTFQNPGDFFLVLTLVDSKGLRGSTFKNISIEGGVMELPIAIISAPPSGDIGKPITFDASQSFSKYKLVSIVWTFGDGSTASGLTVQHVYDAPGNYNVGLTITDEKGLSDSTEQPIEIRIPIDPDQPPAAVINAPASARVGEAVTFDASSSQSASPLTDITWDFGDGQSGTGLSVMHTYAAPATYPVTLRITNEKGQTADTAVSIQIDLPDPQPDRPVARIVGPPQGQVNQSLTFDASTSSASAPITDIIWDLGDGTTASGLTAAHAYSAVGTYQVLLTLADQNGQHDSAAMQVEIVDAPQPGQPPVPVISAPTEALIGENIVFDGNGSQASVPLTAIDWDFGDGTKASGLVVNHVYGAEGYYMVTLTLTDQNGQSVATTATVTVRQTEPTPEPQPEPIKPNQPPHAVIDGPSEVMVGETVVFDGSFSQGSSPIVNYQWATGDGAGGSGMAVSYAYGTPGVYQVTLTVTDQDGQNDTATAQITVKSTEQPTPFQPEPQPEQPTPVQPEPQPEQPTPFQPEPQPEQPTPFQPEPQPEQPTPFQPEPQPEQPTPVPTEPPQPEPQPVQPPTAVINGPQQVQAQEQANFDGGASSGSSPIVNYQWAFGDGATASGPQASHAFGAQGSYEVTLTVTDQNGLSHTTSMTVYAGPSQAELDAQRQAEEEARRQAEEEARRQAEEQAAQQAAEATRQAEEEARRQAEEEARRQAEEEARRQAEEEARRQAEEEARRQAEEEARRQAEEATRQAEEEARRQAEQATRQAEEAAQQQLDISVEGN